MSLANLGFRAALLFAAIAAISATTSCGWGGGEATPTPMTPTPMPAEDRATFESPSEYLDQLRLVKAAYAYARGATGEGETVLVVDTGISTTHQEFAGSDKAAQEPLNPGSSAPSGETLSHGTAVAGVAAGNRGSGDMHGVAPNARIHLAYVRLGMGGPISDLSLYPIDSRIESHDMDQAEEFRRALSIASNQDAAVINLSYGFTGAISAFDESAVRDKFRHTAEALEQREVDDADKKIMVWAAGNLGGTHLSADEPEILAGLGVVFEELRSHVIAVVSVDTDSSGGAQGAISGFSNHCGDARDFCLAAPGGQMTVPNWEGDDEYEISNGTSLAAPMVSGALAVMRQFFRGQLGSDELVDRMLTTADRTGRYSDSDIYGQGLLDLDAATRSRGVMRMMTGAGTDGPSVRAFGTRLGVLGPAAGDAIGRAFSGREVAFLDELDAPFFRQLNSLVDDRNSESGSPDLFRELALQSRRMELRLPGGTIAFGAARAPGQSGEARISRLALHRELPGGHGAFLSLRGQPGRLFGPHRRAAAARLPFDRHPQLAAPWLGFAANGVGAGGAAHLPSGGRVSFGLFRGNAMFPEWEEPAGENNLGAILEAAAPEGVFSLQAGFLREKAGALGLDPRGAMSAVDARTFFAGATAAVELGERWRAAAAAFAGRTVPRLRPTGMIRAISPIASSAFGIGLQGQGAFRKNDLVDLSLSWPLRIERGSMSLDFPAGRTRYGEAVRERFVADLEPSGREIDLRLSYSRPTGAAGDTLLRFAAGYKRDSGHVSGKDEPYGMLQLRRTF